MAEDQEEWKLLVKVPQFDGEKKNYSVWWMRIQAHGAASGYGTVLVATRDPDLPAKQLDATNDSEKNKAARKRNGKAMNAFMLAFSSSDSLLRIIYRAKTKDWPMGEAYLVVQGLQRKYKPTDKISRMEMQCALSQVSMGLKDDPSVLFDQLSVIQDQYNTETRSIDEEDLMGVVMSAVPKEYKGILAAEQLRNKDAFSLADMEDALDLQYRATYGIQNMRKIIDAGLDADHEGHETSFAAFAGKCFQCGRAGHRKEDCWELEKNAHKRPKWWSMKKDEESKEVGGSAFEFLF